MRISHGRTAQVCIESLELIHLVLPLKESIGSEGTVGSSLRDTILVTLRTRDGHLAVGECAPPPGPEFARGVYRCWSELCGLAPRILCERSFFDLDDLEFFLPVDGLLHPSTRAGIETALWDIVGQVQERSLVSLLGGEDERIEAGIEPSVVLGPFRTVVDALHALESHIEEGIHTYVISLLPGLDIELIESVRSHFPECLFAADAGSRVNRTQSEVFQRLDDLDLLWIDDPLPAADIEGLVRLQAIIQTPICLDASHQSAVQAGGCHMARLNIQTAGGLGAARRLHDFCAGNQVGCRVCTGPESGVGIAQALALATLPNCKDPSGLAPLTRWYADTFIKPPIELDDQLHQRLRITTRPGLGHAIDWVRVHEHQVNHAKFLTQ